MENYLLNNRFRIIKPLGHGGFGTTYLAVDRDNKSVVIKELSMKNSDWIKSSEYFEREARTLYNLKHPGIPGFVDFFNLKTENGIRYYLVQEYIDGKNLNELIKQGKRFTEPEVLKIALEVSKIFEYLHKFSPPVIHRDIKPSNIMINNSGQVYLIDFGAVVDSLIFSKIENQGLSTIIGTQGYIPPEQFNGKVYPVSDIYSLGITLITILSQKEPIHFKSKKDGITPDFESQVNISKKFIRLINQMIDLNYQKRPDSVAIIKEISSFVENSVPEKNSKPIEKTKISVHKTSQKEIKTINWKVIFFTVITVLIPLFLYYSDFPLTGKLLSLLSLAGNLIQSIFHLIAKFFIFLWNNNIISILLSLLSGILLGSFTGIFGIFIIMGLVAIGYKFVIFGLLFIFTQGSWGIIVSVIAFLTGFFISAFRDD